MDCIVTSENFETVAALYDTPGHSLRWESLFVTPVWLETWWNSFAGDNEPYILAVREGNDPIGIAPLMRNGNEVRFIGDSDVCDYLDFVLVPGKEDVFFETLLDHLKQQGVTKLDLQSIRPDSTIVEYLAEIALTRRYEVEIEKNDVSLDIDLPDSWDGFLQLLNSKQRHETRRKLRRLEEAGNIRYYSVGSPEEVRGKMDLFLKMFTESRDDKADFLTSQREGFFRSLADNLSEAGIYRFGILELDSVPVAMIIYFDFNDGYYLYNSGFETEHIGLSVGLLSKVLSIRECIESGKKVFDFLKGDEVYKYRLGGKEIPVSNCRITIK